MRHGVMVLINNRARHSSCGDQGQTNEVQRYGYWEMVKMVMDIGQTMDRDRTKWCFGANPGDLIWTGLIGFDLIRIGLTRRSSMSRSHEEEVEEARRKLLPEIGARADTTLDLSSHGPCLPQRFSMMLWNGINEGWTMCGSREHGQHGGMISRALLGRLLARVIRMKLDNQKRS